MAVFYGNLLTNQVATPATINQSKYSGAVLRQCHDTWEFTDNANGDYTVVFKVPVDGVPTSLIFGCDALTSGTASLGLYKLNTDGTFSEVDLDCFATAIAVSSAVVPAEQLFEAAATNIANVRKTFWEWGSLTSRPAYNDIYVVVTNETGTGAAGTGYLKLQYTV